MKEFSFQSFDHTLLHGVKWNDISQSIANIIIIHGYADHILRYDHVAKYFNQQNMNVVGLDLRGHGRSSGYRGGIIAYQDYMLDLESFILFIEKELPHFFEAPTFLLAHSNGGLVALKKCISQDKNFLNKFRGFIFSSPLIELKLKVPRYKLLLAELLSKYFPNFSLPSGITSEALSHDPQMIRAHAEDLLVFRHATTRYSTEMFLASETVRNHPQLLDVPYLMLTAEQDSLVSCEAAKKFHEKTSSKDKEIIHYDLCFHEILNETNRNDTFKAIEQWIRKRI